MWGIFAVLAIITVVSRGELAVFFIFAGLLVLVVKAPPQWLPKLARMAHALFAMPVLQFAPAASDGGQSVLLDILLFFAKAGAFGSGLAVVPFLYQGVVQDFHWLSEQQFTDAVAVAMITPGPVVITVAIIGYLVAGLPGASIAAIGIFLFVFVPVAVLSPWFKRHRDNAQLKAFVQGRHRGCYRRAHWLRRDLGTARHFRRSDRGHRVAQSRRAVAHQVARTDCRRRSRPHRIARLVSSSQGELGDVLALSRSDVLSLLTLPDCIEAVAAKFLARKDAHA